MKKVLTNICYLCGKPLGPPTNADHPVMQQLFAPEIRRKYNISKLLALDVHKSCNTAYKHDEDYFVRTLMPFARGSESGNAIYAKVLNDYRVGKEVLLTRKVLREFDPTPGGLILPGGKVVKRFESERLRRVAWKMVRGYTSITRVKCFPNNERESRTDISQVQLQLHGLRVASRRGLHQLRREDRGADP